MGEKAAREWETRPESTSRISRGVAQPYGISAVIDRTRVGIDEALDVARRRQRADAMRPSATPAGIAEYEYSNMLSETQHCTVAVRDDDNRNIRITMLNTTTTIISNLATAGGRLGRISGIRV